MDVYLEEYKTKKMEENVKNFVWPCVLEILPKCIFNNKNPIILGVKVLDGEIHRDTPICVPSKDFINIGKVSNIQKNNTDVKCGVKGESLAISITPIDNIYSFDRHFNEKDKLFSRITRESIDSMKIHFPNEIKKWLSLFKNFKTLFNID